ncbi:hypothetical protein [Lactiplantibacillus carotarum]|uniref:hypothetical protein n=1 Tax=Lactiplantibacillus carotarum TaxID=2993456 RepID=UPI00298EE42E|nr:hypothetical protein [Lactiplantibacillus carotarum]
MFKGHFKRSSFAHLIKVYTAIISVMVVLATGVFIWVSVRTYNAEVSQAETTAERQVSQMLSQNQQVVSQVATQITSATTNLPSIEKYFNTSLGDYSDYAINQSIKGKPYFFWPTEARQVFIQYDQVEKLTLRLASQKRVFMATPKIRVGPYIRPSRCTNALPSVHR